VTNVVAISLVMNYLDLVDLLKMLVVCVINNVLQFFCLGDGFLFLSFLTCLSPINYNLLYLWRKQIIILATWIWVVDFSNDEHLLIYPFLCFPFLFLLTILFVAIQSRLLKEGQVNLIYFEI
jgi:hypothetical protein